MPKTVIIVGAGRVGRRVADQLGSERNTVTVIERDGEKCEQVSTHVSRVIQGDGTDPETFAEATSEGVDVVAALTNDTETNLGICEMSKEQHPEAETLLRISMDGQEDYAYRVFVDHVVYPAAAGADEASGVIQAI